MISYQTEGVKMPDIKKKKTTGWIKEVAACYGKRVGEIAYIFCSDDKILEVNRQYLQHDYYTDIITFDYCDFFFLKIMFFYPMFIRYFLGNAQAKGKQKQGTFFNENIRRGLVFRK